MAATPQSNPALLDQQLNQISITAFCQIYLPLIAENLSLPDHLPP
jgi:hypothetical protein